MLLVRRGSERCEYEPEAGRVSARQGWEGEHISGFQHPVMVSRRSRESPLTTCVEQPSARSRRD